MTPFLIAKLTDRGTATWINNFSLSVNIFCPENLNIMRLVVPDVYEQTISGVHVKQYTATGQVFGCKPSIDIDIPQVSMIRGFYGAELHPSGYA